MPEIDVSSKIILTKTQHLVASGVWYLGCNGRLSLVISSTFHHTNKRVWVEYMAGKHVFVFKVQVSPQTLDNS